MLENHLFWYAARTRFNQEFSLAESLKKLNIEIYLPTRIETRKLSDRVKKVEVPVIRNLLFIRTTQEQAFALATDYGLKISYLRNRETGKLLIVPDRQMDHFKFVMELSESEVYSTEAFAPGDKVRIIRGPFSGVEGELTKIAGRMHVVVRIPQVAAVGVKVSRVNVERI